ncbi:hypothetical protein SDC9_167517 [bioreactor metagenome]|uniref:Uncharacterized protein n=1 Tax=bioreactor metagenome TaxID=1076179 RepID=A0A645G2L0_9ZZZZ
MLSLDDSSPEVSILGPQDNESSIKIHGIGSFCCAVESEFFFLKNLFEIAFHSLSYFKLRLLF